MRVCMRTVLSPENVANTDLQLKSRELTVDIVCKPKPSTDATAAAAGPVTLTVPIMPLRMTGVRPVASPAPGLGEHTAEILASLKKNPRQRSKL